MTPTSQSHRADLDVVPERHSNDLPSELHSGQRSSAVARVLEHLRENVPAGQPFSTASLKGLASQGRIAGTLWSLNKWGVVTRVSRGVYTHDGSVPVGRHAVRRVPGSPRQPNSRAGKVRVFVTEQLSPGEPFRVRDIVGLGSREAVKISVKQLLRSGFLVSAGNGWYVVVQEGQPVKKMLSWTARVRAEVMGMPDARTFGPGDLLHFGDRGKLNAVLEMFERNGDITRVGRAVYVRAGSPSSEVYVPFSARVWERIRELPAGQTFSGRSGLFEDLGSRQAVKNAFTNLLARGHIERAAWGTYVAVDRSRPQEAAVILSIKQQALLQIEARVPFQEKFTVEVLDIPKSLNALHLALSELNKEGVITRVALGVYVRTPPLGG